MANKKKNLLTRSEKDKMKTIKNSNAQPKRGITQKKTVAVQCKSVVKQNTIPVTVKKHRDNQGNHNHVILGSVGNKHVSVGLTTQAKKGKNSTNYRLQKDTLDIGQKGYKPKNPTFMRRQGTVDYKTNYHRESKGSMTKKDYKKAVEYGNKAKEKFLQKKSNGSAKRVNQSPSAMGQKSTRPLLKNKVTKKK